MGHGYLSTLLQAACVRRDARETRRAGTLLAIVVLIGETAGLHTWYVETPCKSWGCIISKFYFLTDPPIFAETLYIASK